MMLNKKEITVIFILFGTGVLGWGIKTSEKYFGVESNIIQVVADTSFLDTVINNVNLKCDNSNPISLNSADVIELQRIKGVGSVLAQRIVAYRRKHGSFLKVKDLTNVKGIGLKKLRVIEKFVVLKEK